MSDLEKAGIEGFTTIAARVSLYAPNDHHADSEKSPVLIVLCSWMGAHPKHIAKYTGGYQKLFPGSAILLVQTSIGDTFASDRKQAGRLDVAIGVILAHRGISHMLRRPIVLHAMSNGGGIACMRIAKMLKERGHSKVFNRFILDCQPSRPNKELSIKAMAMQLPNNFFIRLLGTWLLRVWTYVGLFIYVTLLRREDIITRLRRMLNDPKVFDLSTDRLYLYTKKDALVPYRQVHEHADEARSKGYIVKEHVWETAPHCGLVREDSARYWNAIEHLVRGPV